MKIDTTRFGMQDIDPSTVLSFPRGLPGFESCTEFKLFHEEKDNPIVFWLQALNDPDVSCSVVDPTLLGFHYELTLQDDEIALIQMERVDDVAVLLMLSTAEQAHGEQAPGEQALGEQAKGAEARIRPNITAPVIVNTRTRIGFQKPLQGLDYFVTFKAPPVIQAK
jgi:flagellar assembly factor FliW